MIFKQSSFTTFPLKDKSIQAVITSPPYWALRKYNIPDININGWTGQYGLEPDFRDYLLHTMIWINEVWRVLKDDGCLFINIGDSYNNSSAVIGRQDKNKYSDKQGIHCLRGGNSAYPSKSKLLIPERLMIMMADNGWIIRNHIVWHKSNGLPESVTDRFTKKWETIIFAVKQPKYSFYLDEAREKWQDNSIERNLRGVGDTHKYIGDIEGQKKQGINKARESWISPKYQNSDGHSNRQGLNRLLDIVTLKAYKEYQQPIAKYLKSYIKPQHKSILDAHFGQHKWRHWIRTDYSGASLVNVEDWFHLKKILNFDTTFDDKIYEVQKFNIPIFRSGRNPGDVWTIPTTSSPEKHYAMYPEKLVERMMLCSTKKGDIVLDPFIGSGTTKRVAEKLNRKGIGFDLGYHDIQKRRLSKIQKELL